jgi:hypothetical protein
MSTLHVDSEDHARDLHELVPSVSITHLTQKFGKRIIVKYLCYTYGINHNSVEQLDDLMRVFHVLNGKPEGDHRQGIYAKLSDAFRVHAGYPKVFENEYLSIRLFGNGNRHILFKRLDLVDAMNSVRPREAFPERTSRGPLGITNGRLLDS